jgi:lipoprotein-releasing system permease protein
LDKLYVLADIRHIQSLNNWPDTLISGFEVLLENYEALDQMDNFIYDYIGVDLNSLKITDRFKEIFGWLELLDMNVWVILIFSILVAGINMISAMLILILERTQMIGLLKALGANNWSVRKIFLINAAYLIGVGLFWGNVIGVTVCLLQKTFGIVTLPQETYYITMVPVNLNAGHLIFLNAGTFILCLCMLVLPSYVITKITPVRAIRFN